MNFDGTTNTGGFCTIRASFNVTSVADNGTGDYTVNFTNAMPDANYTYSLFSASNSTTSNYIAVFPVNGAILATSIQVRTIGGAGVIKQVAGQHQK